MTEAIGTRAPTATRAAGRVALPTGQLRPSVARRALLLWASLVLADATAAAGCLVTFELLSQGAGLAALLTAPLLVVWAKLLGLYKREPVVIVRATLDELPQLIAAAAGAIFVASAAGFLPWKGWELLAVWASLTAALFAARVLARAVTLRWLPAERALVVGSDRVCGAVRRKIANTRRTRLLLVGHVTPHGGDRTMLPDKRLGDLDTLADVVEALDIERVLIDARALGPDRCEEVVRLCHALGVRAGILAPLPVVAGNGALVDDLDGLPLVALREFGPGRAGRIAKRALDIAVAAVLVVVLAPLMLAIALAIKATSPGPVFFRQTRIGRHGRPFQMLKFRTMVDGADRLKPLLLDLNQAAAPLFKIANDPRTTRVGRLLRCYSLDELPQLFNVLRGDMSLVGPRPLVPEEDRFFVGWQRARHAVAPGMTGSWQILGSSRVPLDEMAAIDYRYCASWSLWEDCKILARTLPYVLSAQSGEHPPRERRPL